MVGELAPNREQPGAAIRCDAVSRSFAGTGLVLDRISFQIEPGEFVALLGPSGSGKSSLLRLIAGLDRPDSGELFIDAAMAPLSRGFVFQEATLLPWRTVLRNTTLPLELAGWNRADAQRRAAEELTRVRLADFAGRYPHQLSGGMKMRAAVARALTTRPNLLLLDEPFAALDEPTRYSLQMQLRDIWLTLGMTVLFVTHSVSEAVFLADRIIILSPRPACLLVDEAVPLPQTRDAALRTALEYVAQVRRIGAAMPVSGENR
jgi:NitT/TauT family transport system ATP-binding protein